VNAAARLNALREQMTADGVPAMLITTISNVAYLTGFEGVLDDHANATCLITPDAARFYTDHRYLLASTTAATGTEWAICTPEYGATDVAVCRALQEEGVSVLAVESSMSYARFVAIAQQFVGRVESTTGTVERLRQVKSPEELERIAKAAAITDRAFEYICGFVKPGMTERQIALELEVHMRSNGSVGLAFEPIVASGPNSALPHAQATDRTVQTGEFLKMDFGARFGGYCSDMTRTVVVGKASEKHREIHAAVLAANRAGVDAVRAGVVGKDVHEIARGVLDDAGFGEYFTHGLGHGVGLDVHELPSVGARSDDVLPEHAVVTVEPGVYLEGFGGVRIEALVVVEADGARVVSASPRELIEL
jgi:Xaa-Pro aminopeptidase